MDVRLSNAARAWDAGHPWGIVGPDGAALSFTARGEWPAKWVYLAAARRQEPVVAAYRRVVETGAAETVRVYVSADERYDLFVDGVCVGRGPERGDPRHWYYDAYDLALTPGRHVVAARVWSLGMGLAPWSQVGLRHGFLLAAQEAGWNERLGTGVAGWEGKLLPGYAFRGAGKAAWMSVEVIDGGAMDWEFARGGGEGWQAATADLPARSAREASFVHTFEHALYPGRLPALHSTVRRGGRVRCVDEGAGDGPQAYHEAACLAQEVAGWQAWVDGGTVTVPARTRRRVLIDLGDYVNAYPRVAISGGKGGCVEMAWAEALQRTPAGQNEKGQRDRIDGLYCNAASDTVRLGGGECAWQPLWWRCGRYVQLVVQTAGEAATLRGLSLEETRYPYEEAGAFGCDDEALNRLMPLCVRSAQCCAHESFMDCPYYEQQMWVGDMRVQMLISHVVSGDARLVKRCIEYIGETREAEGIVFGRYPAPQRLWIPSFALAWVGMLSDLALWRGEQKFVRRMMPAARGTFEALLANRQDGLVRAPGGWNYTDWARGERWNAGEPPRSLEAPSAVLNWQIIGALGQVAALERWLDEPELAARWERLAGELAARAVGAFWREERGLLADDPEGRTFSEHAQALAVLSGRLPAELRARLARTLVDDGGLAQTSLYFDCYLLDALRELGRSEAFFARLEPYLAFPAQGFRTTPETADPTRSDCHAWSAHPRYHMIRSVLGVAPAAWGFEAVEIRPTLGRLRRAEGVVPHPRGLVRVKLERAGAQLRGEIELPEGVGGVLHDADRTVELHGGAQTLACG